MTDQEIIDEVNDLAWELAQSEGLMLERGFRFDRSHHLDILNKWRKAVAIHKDRAGIDGQAALARNEAEIGRRLTG